MFESIGEMSIHMYFMHYPYDGDLNQLLKYVDVHFPRSMRYATVAYTPFSWTERFSCLARQHILTKKRLWTIVIRNMQSCNEANSRLQTGPGFSQPILV